MVAGPRNHRFLRKQGTQNPGFRKDVGVFLARCEPQDRGQIATQHDCQFILVGHEPYLIDQGAEHLRGFGLSIFALQAFIERRDALAVDLCHVRVQKGRWLLSVGKQVS
jgi:hypothetical protein